MITINNRQRKIKVNLKKMEHHLSVMLQALGYPNFDVGVLLTTNVTIRRYNRDYRHKDKATDILSFPYHTQLKAGEKIKVSDVDDKNLGDMIISLEYVQKDAPKTWNRSFEEHLTHLLAHGLAHLLNYDHQTDEEFAVMQKVEKKLLKAIANL